MEPTNLNPSLLATSHSESHWTCACCVLVSCTLVIVEICVTDDPGAVPDTADSAGAYTEANDRLQVLLQKGTAKCSDGGSRL